MDDVFEPPPFVDAVEATRTFLLSLFEIEAPTDDQIPRYAEAIVGVWNLEFDVHLHLLQVKIAAIFGNFVLKSQERPENPSRRRYNFIESANISNCREEDAIEFMFVSFAKCNEELRNDNLSNNSKIYIETTKNAIFYVFNMLLRAYLPHRLSPQRAFLVFVKRLLEDTVPSNFLGALVDYLVNPEFLNAVAIGEVFNPIFDILRSGFMAQQFELNNDDNAQDILSVMNTLLALQLPEHGRRPLCEVLVSRADFLPISPYPSNGREFALNSFLGPFFSYGLKSSSQHPNTRVFVDMENDAQKSDGSMNIQQKQFSKRILDIRCGLHDLLHPIAANSSTTNKLLAWMAIIVQSNHQRSQSQYELEEVCGDHFLTNFLFVLYRFTEQIDLSEIILEYPFSPFSSVDISNETRLRMDDSMAKEFELQYTDRPIEYDFSTNCFFLTVAAQKLVFPPLILQIKEDTRRITELRINVDNALNNVDQATSTQERRQLAEHWKSMKETWETMCRHLLCVKTQIQDPVLQQYAFDFATNQLKIVMKTVYPDPTLFGDESLLPAEPTQMFCAYPEHYLEDVLDIFTLCLHSACSIVLESSPDWISLCTVLFTHSNYIHCPFIVTKLVNLLANLPPPLWENVINLITSQQRLLLIAMVKIYLAFEFSEDLDEKCVLRLNIQKMLGRTCKNSSFNAVFMDMARECGQEFMQFVNAVINDVSWCTDESFSGLKIVHEIERKMANVEEWEATDQGIRDRDLEQLNLAKETVNEWIGPAHSNLQFLQFITQFSPEPFLTPALGGQLAAMLNHSLYQLLGSNHQKLSVRNPASYGWQPREFIKVLISIYSRLNAPAFIKYIAYDERTYTPVFFNDVISRLKLHNILSISELEHFEDIAKDAKNQYDSKILFEKEYNNVPEEFKDPIMDTIMEDPVELPSGHVMDRAVIERHLLSFSNNPFNRAPLTKEELMPVVELKAKIEEWNTQKSTPNK